MRITQNLPSQYRFMRQASSQFPHWRPATWRVLGAAIHPAAVVNAWYAADCPPRLDTSVMPLRTRATWAVSRFLRGVEL